MYFYKNRCKLYGMFHRILPDNFLRKYENIPYDNHLYIHPCTNPRKSLHKYYRRNHCNCLCKNGYNDNHNNYRNRPHNLYHILQSNHFHNFLNNPQNSYQNSYHYT